MSVYYVGAGGSDSNNGTTWALRKLTLNGAEDIPVAANDTVYVGPGVYRELLTIDVGGSSGQPITYIGDVTGENTDGVGGVVRITGSDNDTTATRANCIAATTGSCDYRTFRGFTFDLVSGRLVNVATALNGWIFEDCYFGKTVYNAYGLYLTMTTDYVFTVRRCVFNDSGGQLYLFNTVDISVGAASLIEDCTFMAGAHLSSNGVYANNVSGFTVKNCTFYGLYYAARANSLATSTYFTVNNCIFENNRYALNASASGEIVSDYNAVSDSNNTGYTNVSAGSNDNTYPALLEMPLLKQGYIFPWNMLAPSKWSQLARIAGTGEATEDLHGLTRPTTSAKKSWGAMQYLPGVRETTTTRGSSAASIKLADAGRHQIYVPVTAVSTTISVYAYHEANYAGTLPQMVIRQPGISDRTTVDTGSASTWNQLTDTFTPDADTDFVIVELVSNNTATSGSFATYFDDLAVG